MNHEILTTLIAEANRDCYNRDYNYGDAKLKQIPLIFEEELTMVVVNRCLSILKDVRDLEGACEITIDLCKELIENYFEMENLKWTKKLLETHRLQCIWHGL